LERPGRSDSDQFFLAFLIFPVFLQPLKDTFSFAGMFFFVADAGDGIASSGRPGSAGCRLAAGSPRWRQGVDRKVRNFRVSWKTLPTGLLTDGGREDGTSRSTLHMNNEWDIRNPCFVILYIRRIEAGVQRASPYIIDDSKKQPENLQAG
jgi:hypothetical protein